MDVGPLIEALGEYQMLLRELRAENESLRRRARRSEGGDRMTDGLVTSERAACGIADGDRSDLLRACRTLARMVRDDNPHRPLDELRCCMTTTRQTRIWLHYVASGPCSSSATKFFALR
jgi:hypothetical protein